MSRRFSWHFHGAWRYPISYGIFGMVLNDINFQFSFCVAGMALMTLGEYLPKLRFFKASIQNYHTKLFLQSIPAPQIHKAAPQSCSPKRFSAAASQSCSPKYSCKEICSPKWLPKTSFQSSSRKLFRKITIESFPPKLHSRAAVFQKFVRNCRARLLLKATPTSQIVSQSCSTNLFLKIIIENNSE